LALVSDNPTSLSSDSPSQFLQKQKKKRKKEEEKDKV
jgi:hypothetical protein